MRNFNLALIASAAIAVPMLVQPVSNEPGHELLTQGSILGCSYRQSTDPAGKEQHGSAPADDIDFPESPQLTAEPSFQTVGLTLTHDQGDCDPNCETASVEYRVEGQATWKDAVNMVYGPGGWEGEYRSAIVGLSPDTTYEVLVTLDDTTKHYTTFTTWKETANWNISRTITPTSGPVMVDTSGSAGNYVLYDLTSLTVNGGSRCITIDGSYVIVRGATCLNQTNTPVKIKDGITDVLVENIEISGFTFPSTAGQRNEPVIEMGNNDGYTNLKRIVLQNNHIHDPAWGLSTNEWNSGLYGIMLREEHGGNHVFRFNTIEGTNQHMFRDGIGGFANHSEWGFAGENINIYGNYITHCGDDCIESEGGGANVKIFNNYLSDYGVAIAVAGIARGPTYIFRNVVGEADGIGGDPGDMSGHIKTGTSEMSGCELCGEDYGQHFVYHNTFVNIPGVESGSEPTAGNHWSLGPKGQHSANNIYQTRSGTDALGDGDCFYNDQANSYRNDMYWPEESLNDCWTVSGLIKSQPTWKQFSGTVNPGENYFARLAPGTSGHDDGIVIPNFSDGFSGAAPDVGAMESDGGPMCFGHPCSP